MNTEQISQLRRDNPRQFDAKVAEAMGCEARCCQGGVWLVWTPDKKAISDDGEVLPFYHCNAHEDYSVLEWVSEKPDLAPEFARWLYWTLGSNAEEQDFHATEENIACFYRCGDYSKALLLATQGKENGDG